MTPLVFLDVDGVLVNARMLKERERPRDAQAAPECIEALNYLLATTGADIAVSSTWRLGRTVIELQDLLDSWGVKGKVIGKTPVMWEHERGREIGQFLLDYGKLPFVILDDDKDMGSLLPFLVQTDFATGLTFADAERAIALLQVDRGLLDGR